MFNSNITQTLKTATAIIVLFITSPSSAQAQTEQDKIYHKDSVDVKPTFPGGEMKFFEFIARNYKMPYRFHGTGRLLVEFVVEPDGTLTDAKLIKDAGQGTGAQALKTVRKSPKWNPGTIGERQVRTRITVPIIIKTP